MDRRDHQRRRRKGRRKPAHPSQQRKRPPRRVNPQPHSASSHLRTRGHMTTDVIMWIRLVYFLMRFADWLRDQLDGVLLQLVQHDIW